MSEHLFMNYKYMTRNKYEIYLAELEIMLGEYYIETDDIHPVEDKLPDLYHLIWKTL